MSDKTTQETGGIGEITACRYLISRGYEIVAQNVHISHKEIDIMARKDDVLVFVEVKTRTFPAKYRQPYAYARPADAVSYKKRMNIIEGALGYVRDNCPDAKIRFDVIEIYFAEYPDKTYKLHKLNHIDGAFDIYGNII